MLRSELVDPTHTAVVTMECQRGVIGDLATFPALAAAVESVGLRPRLADVATGARAHGVHVVHALAVFRRDRLGSSVNAPLLEAASHIEGQLLEGSPAAELVPELAGDDRDITSVRRHGVSPFSGTDLDPILRSIGVRTVVACGASLNVGLLGLAIEAVNLGYSVVLPRDACVAVPADAASAILRSTMSQLATLTTVEELLAAWG